MIEIKDTQAHFNILANMPIDQLQDHILMIERIKALAYRNLDAIKKNQLDGMEISALVEGEKGFPLAHLPAHCLELLAETYYTMARQVGVMAVYADRELGARSKPIDCWFCFAECKQDIFNRLLENLYDISDCGSDLLVASDRRIIRPYGLVCVTVNFPSSYALAEIEATEGPNGRARLFTPAAFSKALADAGCLNTWGVISVNTPNSSVIAVTDNL